MWSSTQWVKRNMIESTLPVLGQLPMRTIPHQIKIKPNHCPPGPQSLGLLLIPNQDNSPLGPLPRNKTTHQDQNLYGGELSSWGVVRIRTLSIKSQIPWDWRNYFDFEKIWFICGSNTIENKEKRTSIDLWLSRLFDLSSVGWQDIVTQFLCENYPFI